MNKLRQQRLRLSLLFLMIGMCGTGVLGMGCASKKIFKDDPKVQKYRERTQALLPGLEEPLIKAQFAWADFDVLPDLLVLARDAEGRPTLSVWANREGKTFRKIERPGWVGDKEDRINFMRSQDLNHDRVSDLVLLGTFHDGSTAKILINNGKGYFYTPKTIKLPPLKPGQERVDLMDVDRDGHVDLFFTGRRVMHQDTADDRQIQFFLNNGKAEFRDATALLLPPLPEGIEGTSFADYNGDGVIDIFLVYGTGRDRLLINNGLGKFTDRTRDLLPDIVGQSRFADWADFDQDGDNDLLVVHHSLDPKSRSYDDEFGYALVNNGNGYFRKGPLRVLPRAASRAVYLLDANGDEIPDMIILSRKGVHYLRGLGKWRFLKESRKRLPFNVDFDELTFADVNADGHLDLFGISRKDGRGRLWLNTFE